MPEPSEVTMNGLAEIPVGQLVQPGAVYLVGAGPGALGTLTVRAIEVLMSCDVVLHDRLVPSAIVALAKPSAEVRYVGKEGNVATDKMKKQQDDISVQLVELAKTGLSVCRLKGGDPMIYGRAGEEMEHLAAAGVPYEVVPAVTAALAAAADASIPLTFRNAASVVRVHTVNPTTTRDENYDWSQFAAPMTTYALYMGLSALDGVCQKMIAAGVKSNTPMAVIDQASMPAMQVVSGTVETLPEAVRGRSDLAGPAIVLLGDVVGLRERLSSSRPAAAPPTNAALMAATSLLPRLGDDELRLLRSRIDTMLGGSGAGASNEEASGEPPSKKPAV